MHERVILSHIWHGWIQTGGRGSDALDNHVAVGFLRYTGPNPVEEQNNLNPHSASHTIMYVNSLAVGAIPRNSKFSREVRAALYEIR